MKQSRVLSGSRQRLTRTGTAGAVLAALLVAPALGAGGPVQAAPYTGPQKIAFTDDEDRLDRVTVTAPDGDGGTYAATFPARVTTVDGEHEGEATAAFYATPYVATQSDLEGAPADADGEVHLRPRQGLPTGFDTKTVTCDNADRETHPVLFVDEPTETYGGTYTFYVAYASDALTGSGDTGRDWNIWVATQSVDYVPNSSSGTDPGPAALLSGACDDWERSLVTDDDPPGDDVDQLWPAYLPSGRGMVYSQTSPEEPLGDLYLRMFDDGESTVTQLTSDGSGAKERADTQPSVELFYRGNQQAEWWVAFTTTRYYDEGSVALLCICDPESPDPQDPVDPLSRGGTSEPSWSSTDGTNALAFTTTDADPYGDVDVALFDPPTFGDAEGGEPARDPQLRQTISVSAQPGVAETHPSFEDPFDRSESSATVIFTARRTEADISDVVAADGSDRQTRVAGSFLNPYTDALVPEDEAWPDLNRDGSKIAYSSEVRSGDGEDGGREIRIADSDGTGAVPVEAGRQIYDVDVDPVFSPTRNQIAFTRYTAASESYDAPVTVIADLDAGTFRQVPAGLRSSDLDPDWSPDGTRLVFSRATGWRTEGGSNRRPGTSSSPGVLFVAPAAGGPAERLVQQCDETDCDNRVVGRQPAWSPDGSTIVYTASGALRSVGLLGGVQTSASAAITGFAANRAAMPSRSRLSAAEDPAWSPDGAEIAFAGQPAGQPDDRGIYAIKPDGSGVRRVTDDRGPDTEPTWTPVSRTVPLPQADLAVALELANPALEALDLDPRTGYVGGTTHVLLVDVVNRSPSTTAASVTLTLDYPPATPSPPPDPASPVFAGNSPQPCLNGVGGCLLGSVDPGDTRTFEVPLLLDKGGAGTVTARVGSTTADPVTANNRDRARLRVLQPTIRLLPEVARPGQVTIAYGENMPPGSEVDLLWDPGITVHRGPFEVDGEDGTARQPLLIVRHDLLGERELEATSVDPNAPAGPPLFSAVRGRMLVAERLAQAPDFLARG